MLPFQYKIYVGGNDMKGYAVADGYMGFVNEEYMLFASEADYMDYMME